MSSHPKKFEPFSPVPAWLLTGLGFIVIPVGLAFAAKIQKSWWTWGLWIAAAGSAMAWWGLVWLSFLRSETGRKRGPEVSAALAFLFVIAASLAAHRCQPSEFHRLDMLTILLVAHRAAAGLVLICLGADKVWTASSTKRQHPWLWFEVFLLVGVGLFGLGVVTNGSKAWRFPALVALGALPFFADYLLRRPRRPRRPVPPPS